MAMKQLRFEIEMPESKPFERGNDCYGRFTVKYRLQVKSPPPKKKRTPSSAKKVVATTEKKKKKKWKWKEFTDAELAELLKTIENSWGNSEMVGAPMKYSVRRGAE